MHKLFNSLKMKYDALLFRQLNDTKSPLRDFKIKIETKCLVLSPYPGCETIGMGGLIAQYPKNFEVLSLTNGSSLIKNVSRIEAINIKREQFHQVMKLARVRGYKIFDINSGELKNEYKKFSKIDISEADFIFIPNPLCCDSDTVALVEHFRKILKTNEYKKTLQIYFWEDKTTLSNINYCANITNITSVKKEMLEKYYPNNERLISAVVGLNKFRALEVNADYAECFCCLCAKDFLNFPLFQN